MKLKKKQLNVFTNWFGGVIGVGAFAGAGDLPLEAIVTWAASINPTLAALSFGVWALFFGVGKDPSD